ncbi:MAG: hypothetical protein WAW75_03675 [Gallionella sp.]
MKNIFSVLFGLLGVGEILRLGIIATNTATTTTFTDTAGPHDVQESIVENITGTGGQDISQMDFVGAGAIMKYQTALIPYAVGATTAAQNTSSVTTTLQPGVYFATNSVYAVNKPTLQAGLGIAGVGCATTGVLNINYLNVSSAALTPTGEANDVIEIKAGGGSLTTTATLSPTAVSLNTSAEQTFTLATSATAPVICLPGTLAIVNKPTNQAGLGYSPFARVVGINQVAITFCAVSSGAVTTAITPTAAEDWKMAFLPQLNAFNPTYIYGIPSGATATGASTTLEQTSGVTGILLSDTISGIARGTTQVLCMIGSYRVTSAGVIGITYGSPGATVTPTTSEVLLATIQRQRPLNPMMIYEQALATSAVAATTSVEVTTTVTGLLVSSSVIVNKPTCTAGLIVTNARVSAADTLAVQYTNLTTTSINVPSETYTIGNVQLQGPGLGLTTTAGLFVAQSYYPSLQQSLKLAESLRTALLAIDTVAATGASV